MKETRPWAKPRYGSVIERLFGTANTQCVSNLLGNTQIMKQVRQVTKSIAPQEQAGIKLHYVYYHAKSLDVSEVQHQQVPVRYDPFDISTIYAYVQKRWVQCRSEHYLQFKGHSERERQLATAELRKQYQNHPRETTITAKRLADFLADLSAHEEVRVQRWHDLEARDVFARMGGIQLFSPDQVQQEEPVPSLVLVGTGSESEQGERAEQETSKRHPSHGPEIDEDDVDLEALDEYEEYR